MKIQDIDRSNPPMEFKGGRIEIRRIKDGIGSDGFLEVLWEERGQINQVMTAPRGLEVIP